MIILLNVCDLKSINIVVKLTYNNCLIYLDKLKDDLGKLKDDLGK